MQPIRAFFVVAAGIALEASSALADPPCPSCVDDAPVTQSAPATAPTGSAAPSGAIASPAPRLAPLPFTRLHFDIGLTGGAIGLFYYNPPAFFGLAGFTVAAGWRAAARGRSSITAYGAFSYSPSA